MVIGFIVGGLVWGFLATGGIGLVRLYKNYLLQNLTEKKYSAQDFMDRGPREMLYGYYAGADSKVTNRIVYIDVDRRTLGRPFMFYQTTWLPLGGSPLCIGSTAFQFVSRADRPRNQSGTHQK